MDCVLAPSAPLLTCLPDSAPAGDPGLAAWRELVGGRGQTDGPDVLVEGDVDVQLHKGDVVVVAAAVIVPVGDDPRHLPPHRPLIGLTLHQQAQEGFPLVGLRVPARKPDVKVKTIQMAAC